MLDDNNDTNPRRNLNERRGMSGTMLAALAVLAVIAVMLFWAPWSGPRIADTTTPSTTVGQSTIRPAAPATNTAPASPSTNR
jgi:hypothetical protein